MSSAQNLSASDPTPPHVSIMNGRKLYLLVSRSLYLSLFDVCTSLATDPAPCCKSWLMCEGAKGFVTATSIRRCFLEFQLYIYNHVPRSSFIAESSAMLEVGLVTCISCSSSDHVSDSVVPQNSRRSSTTHSSMVSLYIASGPFAIGTLPLYRDDIASQYSPCCSFSHWGGHIPLLIGNER